MSETLRDRKKRLRGLERELRRERHAQRTKVIVKDNEERERRLAEREAEVKKELDELRGRRSPATAAKSRLETKSAENGEPNKGND